MFFGVVEMILLAFSGTTFAIAGCLLTWVLVKNKFIQNALRAKGGEYGEDLASPSQKKGDYKALLHCIVVFVEKKRTFMYPLWHILGNLKFAAEGNK